MKKFCFILCFVFVSHLLFSQEEVHNFQELYDAEMIKVEYSIWSGINVNQNGKLLKTNFGGNKELHNIFADYENASQLINKFKVKNRVGNILFYSGFATMSGALAYTVSTPDDDLNPGVSLGLYCGGAISGLIGAIIMDSSVTDFFNAVNSYNENLVRQNSYNH